MKRFLWSLPIWRPATKAVTQFDVQPAPTPNLAKQVEADVTRNGIFTNLRLAGQSLAAAQNAAAHQAVGDFEL